ncbi:hypothetical protein BDQ12DRAFT_650965 [Crucibulum laeve]|uniref:G-protein coupled receptors family 1 profile domain-containing protein n=1 Tax=Crucibulum laeve TaxID=68775 RepID=A0A5C3LZL7_9AGAR|nr:hypothetical protein BDQ12DRAFT_650965 [Crucibulum laeve]
MSTPALEDLPNPFTPLAFLEPTLANQFEVSRYLYAVTLGIYIWDTAINLGNDYQLLFKHRVRYPTVVYYASRVTTLAYILTCFIFQVGHVEHCQALQYALGVCNILSTGTSSMLFLMRIQAVFHGSKTVRMIFFILWLSVTGAAISVPIGISGAHIGPTKSCINTRIAEYTEVTAIFGMLNDTAVFLAISYRILSYSLVEESLRARVKTFFGRGRLPIVSRLLLQGGQQYYLIAACGNIVLLVLVKLPDVPQVYHGMCSIPVLAINNLMACIVFRKVKFGLISNDGSTLTTINYNSTFHAKSVESTHPSHQSTHMRLHSNNGRSSFTLASERSNANQMATTKTYQTDGSTPVEGISKEPQRCDEEGSHTGLEDKV